MVGSVGPELVDLHEYYIIDELKKFLLNPPEDIPPFEGPEAELDALARYLLEGSRKE